MSIKSIRERMITRLKQKGFMQIHNAFYKRSGITECFVSIGHNNYFLYKRTKTTIITATAETRHRCYNKFVRMTNI